VASNVPEPGPRGRIGACARGSDALQNIFALQNVFGPVFEDGFHLARELVAERAVDQAVIER
jgi:hypothetical protein